jgi:hypothetical protein
LPRAAPDQVITHRIELGSFEREKVVEGFKTAATLNAAATGGRVVTGIITGIAGASAAGAVALGLAAGAASPEFLSNLKEQIYGAPETEVVDPVTGETSTTKNLLAGIPLIGGIAGALQQARANFFSGTSGPSNFQ